MLSLTFVGSGRQEIQHFRMPWCLRRYVVSVFGVGSEQVASVERRLQHRADILKQPIFRFDCVSSMMKLVRELWGTTTPLQAYSVFCRRCPLPTSPGSTLSSYRLFQIKHYTACIVRLRVGQYDTRSKESIEYAFRFVRQGCGCYLQTCPHNTGDVW
jgi:hypothetical protein